MLVQGDHSRLAGCRGHPGRTEAWGRAFEAVQLGVPWGLRGQTPWLLSPLPLTGCATDPSVLSKPRGQNPPHKVVLKAKGNTCRILGVVTDAHGYQRPVRAAL